MGRGGAGKWEGRQAKFTPLFRWGGGGAERFYSGSGEERRGGGEEKSLKVDIISFVFFFLILPETHDI